MRRVRPAITRFPLTPLAVSSDFWTQQHQFPQIELIVMAANSAIVAAVISLVRRALAARKHPYPHARRNVTAAAFVERMGREPVETG